jgi:hypothetical protein
MQRGAFVVPVVLACAGVVSARQPPADASLSALLDAATAYVKDYQAALTFILADEVYTQDIRAQVPAQPKMPRTRRLVSTAYFIFVPSTQEWMAIRDVMTVDDTPVADRPDIRAELERLPAAQVGLRLRDYNSRFNLGRAYRNFNEPTMSLQVLDPAYRQNFTFQIRGSRNVGSKALTRVGFTERPSATPLIRDLQLKATLSTGELLIDRATGEIHQAALDVTIGGLRVQLSTTYARDERLGVMVPTVFRERYVQGVEPATGAGRLASGRTGDFEDIQCQANYKNFRRFETAARIK